MNLQGKQELIPYALGQQRARLVLKNASIVDVFTGSVRLGDIAVQNGMIVGVGSYSGEREVDLSGKFVAPGFIDAHVHIESSMVSPYLFAQKILPCGTTTIIADPHEIANVAGTKGIEFLLKDSEDACVNVYIMLPSCVPLNEYDNNGADFDVEQMKKLMNHPRVLGLGEVMNYEAVLAQNKQMLEKLALMQHKVIDGHAPSILDKQLQAYRLAGVQTDHECSTYQEALQRLQSGFVVQVREGSAAKNLEAILTGALHDHIDFSRFVFCTDDMHLDDVANHGHINHAIKKAITLGVDPITAITMATRNAAQFYGLRDLGAVAPGYCADFVVLNHLEDVSILDVYKDGVSITELRETRSNVQPIDSQITHSVHVPSLPPNCLELQANDAFPVITVIPGEIITKKEILPLPQENGVFVPKNDILKIAVVQRHDGSGRIGLGAMKGFGLINGAIAATVAHDAHNLIVLGDNDADMLRAIQELIACNGGYTIVSGGQVCKTLPLPIAGLFTNDAAADVAGNLDEMSAICHHMGVPAGIDPFLNLSFVSLPVIPELRITDNGLFDVLQNRFI